MLDMGFIPDVERITGLLPKIRQTLFYSATLDDEMHKIGGKFVINPKVIEVAAPAATADTVEQFVKSTTPKRKRETLRELIRAEDVANAVIFCNRKRDISTLKTSLERNGFDALALHGDMTQSARNDALAKFKNGDVPLLVASDVAARGIDIAGLSHVFNFDVPNNPEDYVHRMAAQAAPENRDGLLHWSPMMMTARPSLVSKNSSARRLHHSMMELPQKPPLPWPQY